MQEYEVIYEGTIREVYYVMAESADQAERIWSDVEPTISEVVDGSLASVRLIEEIK